ncbi:hypothetical protein, partial [Corallococcus sp. 4LFB]|uniref:hypothetical protein n=1 Tax=Corallococcus sp. 4LFB TaxID=3383249 RepID=UPI0039757FE4
APCGSSPRPPGGRRAADEESSVPELRQAMDRWIARLPPSARRDLKAAMTTPKPADPSRDALTR